MEIKNIFNLDITDESQVASSRRQICGFAKEIGYNEQDIGRIAIVVSEISTNLVKYAEGTGKLLVNYYKNKKGKAICILSLDQGPGIRNISNFLNNNSGSMGGGIGLGAIKRQSDIFDIYSQKDIATAVMAIISPSENNNVDYKFLNIGALIVPKEGEELCGDNIVMEYGPDRKLFMVVDGIGHGKSAFEASKAAVEIFNRDKSLKLEDIAKHIHNVLHGTRGAVLAIAKFGINKGSLEYLGVGNISSSICNSRGCRGLVSYNGTAGYQARKIRQLEYSFEPGSILVMHTDGLSYKWDIKKYPGLYRKHPIIIAGILFIEKRRENDDAAVLVIKR